MNGIELRAEGTDATIAADVAPHRMAGPHIKAAIAELAQSGRTFDADDVRALLPEGVVPHSPNLLPAHMGAAAAKGLIVPVGLTRTRRASRRSSRNLLWVGVAA